MPNSPATAGANTDGTASENDANACTASVTASAMTGAVVEPDDMGRKLLGQDARTRESGFSAYTGACDGTIIDPTARSCGRV
jgi:hypothetical protein